MLLYLVCQSFSGSAAPINIALGAIVGSFLLGPDKSLATAPVTAYNIGVALGAVFANTLMRRVGRKRGFIVGTLIGAAGMFFAASAISAHHFWLFCLALLVNGLAGGFTQQYRFAAADRGTQDFKPKAISWIMAGGIAAAIIGPQLVIHTTDFAAPVPFAGAFYCSIILFVLSFVALLFLNPSNLATRETSEQKPVGRPLSVIVTQPRFLVAVFCGTITYALMSFVMTGAPLAMAVCGYTVDQSTLGIQWHVLAMFAPSFFTGNLIARFGKETIVATGLTILMLCASVALMGIELAHFWGSLILLGLGWNFGFIGATAMVTDTYRPEEKNLAQGANDFVVFGSVAFASLMSGLALNNYGWEFINWMVFPLSIACLASLAWLLSREKPVV